MEGRDALSPDEYVLRRVTAFKYDPTLPYPIPPDHFQPRKEKDDDGISFFRATDYTPKQLADFANNHGWLIAKVKVSDLQDIGLNPVAHGEPGHVCIPDITYPLAKANRDAMDLKKNALAKLLAAHIVLKTEPKSE